MTIANAILVFASEGNVQHRFCPESEARAVIERFAQAGECGAMFVAQQVEAEFAFNASPDLRQRSDSAKAQVKADMQLKEALDRRGVPGDIALRRNIYQAIAETKYSVS